jgi:hypothetical protein
MFRIGLSNERRKPGPNTGRGRLRLRMRPALIELEGRTLLSSLMVNSTADDGSAGTLRWAIGQANASNQAETIVFSSLFNTPQRITLSGSPLVLSNPATTTITGPGENLLTISGNHAGPVFGSTAGSVASLSGLTITGGKVNGNGGGIRNDRGTLALDDIVLRGNSARNGGGLFNNGSVTLTDVIVRGNHARVGGGVFNNGGMMLTDVTFVGNHAKVGGGAFNNGTAGMNDVVVRGNTASLGSGLFSARRAALTRSGLASRGSTTTILNDAFNKNVTGGVPTNWAPVPPPSGTVVENPGNVTITVTNATVGSAGILSTLAASDFSPLKVVTTMQAQVNSVNKSGNAIFGLLGLSGQTETGYLAAGIDAQGNVFIVEQEAGISQTVLIKKDANYKGGSILMSFIVSASGVEVTAPGYDSGMVSFSKNLNNFSLATAFGSGAIPALVAANQPGETSGSASFGSIKVTTSP